MIKTMPLEWVNKLFVCMAEFYGDRWNNLFKGHHMRLEMAQTIWQNGLVGLSYAQIKKELHHQKVRAGSRKCFPPTVIEFFNLAKRHPE